MMNQPGAISASMMCSSLTDLTRTIGIFESQGVERLHIDVMDGDFVPNFGLGVDYISGLRELTSIPLDIHLMVSNPENKFHMLGIRDTDIVSIHYESTPQIQRAFDLLDDYKCKKFLAINPATPLSMLEELLDYIDGINLLMVNPGFAGQMMVPSTMKKAKRLRPYIEERTDKEIIIEVDGNITNENAQLLRGVGANLFVAGSSSIFRNGVDDYRNNIDDFRKAIK